MTPRIETINEKKLLGMRLTVSLADYKVGALWKRFMPRRKEIINYLNDDLVSMAVYKPTYFANFKPTNEFEKWAAVEVTDFNNVPNEMEAIILPSGLYGIFDYKGSSADNSVFQYIFGTWLPGSEYDLDDRPHFEIFGNKYKNNDPQSEEKIWIPIKVKG